MKALRLVLIIALGFFGLVATTTAASASPSWGGNRYNCTGGNVPAGTYDSMIITGICYMPAGTIVVRGGLTVAPGALLALVFSALLARELPPPTQPAVG